MGFLSFFGYFFFVLFGGVGLPALPIDLILEFVNRPKTVKYEINLLANLKRGCRKEIHAKEKDLIDD